MLIKNFKMETYYWVTIRLAHPQYIYPLKTINPKITIVTKHAFFSYKIIISNRKYKNLNPFFYEFF